MLLHGARENLETLLIGSTNPKGKALPHSNPIQGQIIRLGMLLSPQHDHPLSLPLSVHLFFPKPPLTSSGPPCLLWTLSKCFTEKLEAIYQSSSFFSPSHQDDAFPHYLYRFSYEEMTLLIKANAPLP